MARDLEVSMRYRFSVNWRVDTLSVDEVRSALPDPNHALLNVEVTSTDAWHTLAFQTDDLLSGASTCQLAGKWFRARDVRVMLGVIQVGFLKYEFDLLEFLVMNLGWTANSVKSVIRGLKGKRGKRPNTAARNARLKLEEFLERNGG